MHSHKLENQAIEIVANVLCTDEVVTFESRSAMELVGFSMSQRCADIAFEHAGFGKGQGRDKVGVVELHDCFAANEVLYLFQLAMSRYNMIMAAADVRCLTSVPRGKSPPTRGGKRKYGNSPFQSLQHLEFADND